jgi:hypothetical protein
MKIHILNVNFPLDFVGTKLIVSIYFALQGMSNVTVLDRNQAEQGGTGGSGPQILGSGPQFITRISSYSQLFSSWPTVAWFRYTRLVPCNRFLLFYNHPIWTDGRLIKTSSIEERVARDR